MLLDFFVGMMVGVVVMGYEFIVLVWIGVV